MATRVAERSGPKNTDEIHQLLRLVPVARTPFFRVGRSPSQIYLPDSRRRGILTYACIHGGYRKALQGCPAQLVT
jgi:hypothetical protein